MKYLAMSLLSLSTACVPVPYLSPPAHFSLDMYPNPNFTGEIDDQEEPIAGNLAIGLAPLGAFPKMDDRRFDISTGLFLQSTDWAGLYIGAKYWPIVKPLSQKSFLRAGFTGRAAIMGKDEEMGIHYKAGLTAELMGRLQAKDVHLYQKDRNSIGILFGELGMGMDLCMFVDNYGDTQLVGTQMSLNFRMPTGAGVTFIPLEKLKK